jgi:glycosyltransferase involved in cell wall biosynthesis
MSVPPEDSAALANAVYQLAEDGERRQELGRCARAYAESNFERDAVLGRVFARLDGDEAGIPDDVVA